MHVHGKNQPCVLFFIFPKVFASRLQILSWQLVSYQFSQVWPWPMEKVYAAYPRNFNKKKIKGKHICLVGFYVDFLFGRRECLISLWILNNNFELSRVQFQLFFFFFFHIYVSFLGISGTVKFIIKTYGQFIRG